MIVLPEVQFAREHFVQCDVHPGPDRASYAVCPCVLRGAPVEVHKEPTPKRFGYATCALCYANPEPAELVIACPKCVEYHLLSRAEPVIFVPDPTLFDLRIAERDGYREFRHYVEERTPWPRNPYKELLAWAWDLGWRAGVAERRLQAMGAAA